MSAFAKAVGMGTLAGAALPVMVWVVFALGSHADSDGWRSFAILIGMSVALSFAFVFAASLMIGIPTTLVLRHLGAESEEIYVIIGCLTGLILVIAALILISSGSQWWLSLFGVLGGGVTARTW